MNIDHEEDSCVGASRRRISNHEAPQKKRGLKNPNRLAGSNRMAAVIQY